MRVAWKALLASKRKSLTLYDARMLLWESGDEVWLYQYVLVEIVSVVPCLTVFAPSTTTGPETPV